MEIPHVTIEEQQPRPAGHADTARVAEPAHSPAGSCFMWKGKLYRIDNAFGKGGTALLYPATPLEPLPALPNEAFGSCRNSASGTAHYQSPPQEGFAAPCVQPLALKLLDVSFAHDRVARERFMREGELLCRLSHPNLVKGYAVGQWQERPFFIMERIEGATLAYALQSRGQVPPEEALAILRDALSALSYLSLDGRVSAHRDIKPSNIMLDARGNAKLIDLGIAKTSLRVADEIDTRFLGSFHYVAPEQIDNAACVDIRADIYALGAVFYEMCAGTRAFSGENSRAVLASHLTGTIPTLPKTGVFAQDEERWEFCNKILQNTLALDCPNRFQTPSEFLTFLEKVPTGNAGGMGRPWNLQRNRSKSKAKEAARSPGSAQSNSGPAAACHSQSKARGSGGIASIAKEVEAAGTARQQARHILIRIAAAVIGLILLGFLIHIGQEGYLIWKVRQEAPPVGAVISQHASPSLNNPPQA